MSRWVRSMTVVVSASAALLGGAVAVARQPSARAAANCAIPSTGKGYGYTYLTSLTVRGTSCATGKTVAQHHGKVSGWSCSTKRLGTSPVQYQARETCTSGSRRVVWSYSQNR
ncbi:MAG: hypothetical protein M3065_04650 [Actinomycetota bacterium]|nr:hypothetical protein [Actinomycetota bacterium]